MTLSTDPNRHPYSSTENKQTRVFWNEFLDISTIALLWLWGLGEEEGEMRLDYNTIEYRHRKDEGMELQALVVIQFCGDRVMTPSMRGIGFYVLYPEPEYSTLILDSESFFDSQ